MTRNTELPQRHTTNTNNYKIQPRSKTSTQHNEIETTNETMKFQPKSRRQDQNQDLQEGADPCITIRRGVRAGARRHKPTPRGDLGTVSVDLARGW
jgi:hypothetical protein